MSSLKKAKLQEHSSVRYFDRSVKICILAIELVESVRRV